MRGTFTRSAMLLQSQKHGAFSLYDEACHVLFIDFSDPAG
jgi:hypothetical protein